VLLSWSCGLGCGDSRYANSKEDRELFLSLPAQRIRTLAKEPPSSHCWWSSLHGLWIYLGGGDKQNEPLSSSGSSIMCTKRMMTMMVLEAPSGPHASNSDSIPLAQWIHPWIGLINGLINRCTQLLLVREYRARFKSKQDPAQSPTHIPSNMRDKAMATTNHPTKLR